MANVVQSLFGNIAQTTMANPVAAASQPADPLQALLALEEVLVNRYARTSLAPLVR